MSLNKSLLALAVALALTACSKPAEEAAPAAESEGAESEEDEEPSGVLTLAIDLNTDDSAPTDTAAAPASAS